MRLLGCAGAGLAAGQEDLEGHTDDSAASPAKDRSSDTPLLMFKPPPSCLSDGRDQQHPTVLNASIFKRIT